MGKRGRRTAGPARTVQVKRGEQSKLGFKVYGYDLRSLWELSNEIEDPDIRIGFFNNCVFGVMAIIMLVQIRLCCVKEKPQYSDGLPSSKYYKKRIICDVPGRAICAGVATIETLAFMDGGP